MRGEPPSKGSAIETSCLALQILEVLANLHEEGQVIGSLAPSRVVWFSAEHAWKLLDLCAFSARQRERPPMVHLSIRYTAPEIVLSESREGTKTVPESPSDMWSFGVMLLEMVLPGAVRDPPPSTGIHHFTPPGQSLEYPDAHPGADRRIALSRQISRRLVAVSGEPAHALLQNLLHTDPIKRCTASQALHSAFFQVPDHLRNTNSVKNEVHSAELR